MATEEVQRLTQMQPGDTIRIARGDLAGWAVYVDAGRDLGRQGPSAFFTDVKDMVEWLSASLVGIATN